MSSAEWDVLEKLLDRARSLDEDRRDAFLDSVCAGDEGLRRELESLLELADEAERFFDDLSGPPERGVGERDSADDRGARADADGMVGERVGRFEIEERIASGGMGVVYRARDVRLDRTVALKCLPRSLILDAAAKERFLVEARAAAALDHPNICTVHEAGETEKGRLYLAMAFYEGETLEERLARGPLPAARAAEIAAGIARALGAAHERGIVHRDVKPGNVMLTAEGTVKLLDFGVAKLPDVTLTGPLGVPGTVAYMSPEQARGEPVDARTDVWSLGVVLYEMLAGVRPFRGERRRAVLHAILEREPKPLEELRPDAPESLLRVTRRAMRKDPGERPRSAKEILAELEGTASGGPVLRRDASVRSGPARRRVAALVAAAVALAAGWAAWTWIDGGEAGSGGVAESVGGGDVVVADFVARGADTALAGNLTEMLRIGLAQSPTVEVASRWRVAEALRRMRRTESASLTLDLAREVAVREGIDLVIGGRVQRSGSGYVIAASLVQAETGEVERGWIETPDSTDLSDAIGRLTTSIRDAAGESLAAHRRGERPLESSEAKFPAKVTTPSLEAVKAYRRALRSLYAGEPDRAVGLFEEAIARDSTFAAAHAGLGTALALTYASRGRELEAFARAFDLRDQLTDWERFRVAGMYHRASGDLPRALEAFRSLNEVQWEGHAYVGIGLCLLQAGDLEASEEAFRAGWATETESWDWSAEMLIRVVHRDGRVSEAWNLLRRAEERYPGHPIPRDLRIEMSIAAGDYAAADSLAARVPLGASLGLAQRHPLRYRAVIDAIRGKYHRALARLAELTELQRAAGMSFPAFNNAIYAARLELARGDTAAARARVEGFLERTDVEELHRLSRPFVQLPLADFFADAGDVERARGFVRAYDRTVEPEFATPGRTRRDLVLAKLAAAAEESERTLDLLSRALRQVRVHGHFDYDLPILMPVRNRPEVARIYAAAGRPDSAIAVYRRYLADSSIRRTFVDAYELAGSLEHVARLYEEADRPREAARHYDRVARLWEEADAELQPRVRRARSRAAQLAAR